MKITLDGKDLSSKLKLVVGSYNPAEPSSYVAFSLVENQLVIFAESISTYCKVKTDVIDKEDGELNVFVDGNTLKTLSTILPPVPITVTVKEDELVFKFNRNSLKLPIVVGDVSAKHQPKVEKIGVVSAENFLRTLKESFKVASREAVVESMKCTNLHFSDSHITVCSTDSYVLLKESIQYDKISTEKFPSQVLIKYTEIPLLISVSPEQQVLEIYYGSGKFGIKDENDNLLLVGYSAFKAFPYSVVENALGTGFYLTVKKSDLKSSLDVLSKLTITDSRDIQTKLVDTENGDKELEFSGARKNVVRVPLIETNATELSSTFVIEVLLKAINSCNSSELYFEWSEESIPYGLFGTIAGNKDTSKLMAVMPKVG